MRLGIGHGSVNGSCLTVHGSIDWPVVKALAEKHGLSAVVLDGIGELRKNGANVVLPDEDMLMQWIGEVLQAYEYQYKLYRHAIADLAGFYNSHGYKMMLLKGYACSIDWPRPEHRPCGDIDIWLFGRQAEADAVLGECFKVNGSNQEIDKSHHHHTVFYWRDFMVENHYDFINVHHHKSNAEVEQVLKSLGSEDNLNDNLNVNNNSVGNRIPCIEVYGETVYLPSANLHALFLLKHNMMHFAAEGITLRQLLDWGFFIKAHHQEIDWLWFIDILEQYGMTTMFNIFNAICVEDLGFDFSVNVNDNVDSNTNGTDGTNFNQLKERVLKEVLEPEFGDELPKSLIPRLVFKYRRWKANQWKHELCYKESMWSAFWSGVVNHLLKPSSI